MADVKPVTAISSINNKIILIADGDVVIENAGTTEVPSNLKLEAVTSTTITSDGSNIVGGEEYEVEGSGSSSTALGQVIIRSDANADDIGTVDVSNATSDSIAALTTDIYYNPNIVTKGKTHAQSGAVYNEKDYTNYANESAAYKTLVKQNVNKKITDAKTGVNKEETAPTAANRNVYMLINNVEQLQDISLGSKANLNGAYAQGTNIEAGSTVNWNSGAGFDPIGNDGSNSAFTGRFTGNGGIASYSINNMTINRVNENNVGVFGYAQGAGFSSINMIGATIKGQHNVGAIVGSMQNSSLHASSTDKTGTVNGTDKVGGLVGFATDNSNITWSTNNATVTGNTDVAGVVGYADKTNISNSTNRGNITGTNNTGGIAGSLLNGSTVSASRNQRIELTTNQYGAAIVGTENTGGIAGYMSDSTIQGLTHNNGTVQGSKNTGGLVGNMLSGKIDSSYNTNEAAKLGTTVDTTNSPKSEYGHVTGTGDNTGGLVGYMQGGTIDNAYNAGNVDGKQNVGGIAGNMSGGKVTNSYNGDNNTVYIDPSVTATDGKINHDEYYGFTYNGVKYYCERMDRNDNRTADGKTVLLLKGEVIYYTKDGNGTRTYIHPNQLKNMAQSERVHNVRLAYRDANITGTANVGGAIGNMSGGEANNIYNAGTVALETGVSGTAIGGLIGTKSSGTVVNSFNINDDTTHANAMSNQTNAVGSGDVMGITNITLQKGRSLEGDKTIFGTTLGDDSSVVWSVGLDSTLPLLQQKYMTWAKINRVFEYDGSVHNLRTDDVAHLYGSAFFEAGSGDGKNVFNGIQGSDTNAEYQGSTVYKYAESNLWSPQHGYYMTSDSSLIITPKELTVNVNGSNYYNNYANDGYQIDGKKPKPGTNYQVSADGLIAGETLDGATDIGSAWANGGNDGYKYDGDGYQKGTAVGSYDYSGNVNGLSANNGNYTIKYKGKFDIIKAEFYYVADQVTYMQGLPIYKPTGKVVDVYGNVIDPRILVDNNGEFFTNAIQGSVVGKYQIYGQGNSIDANGRPMWTQGNNYTIVQVAANDTALTIIPNDTYQTEVGHNASIFGGQIERIGIGSVRYLSMKDNGINTGMMPKGHIKLQINQDGTMLLDEVAEKEE